MMPDVTYSAFNSEGGPNGWEVCRSVYSWDGSSRSKTVQSGMTRKDAQALAKKLNSENVRFAQ